MLKLYIGGQFTNRHEVEQFNNILSIIKENENKLGNFCVIFGSAWLAGEQLDCLIFKENAIIAIEMKKSDGIISGGENGEFWNVNGDPIFKNIFNQCTKKKFAVYDEINSFFSYKKRLDVQSWALFDYGADCSQVACSKKNEKWFKSIPLDSLLNELILQRSPRSISDIKTVERFASKLLMDQRDFNDWMSIRPEVQIEDLKHIYPSVFEGYDEYVFDKNSFQEYVIRYPHSDSKELFVIAYKRQKKTGKEYLSTAIRVPLDTWEDVEDYLLKVEYTWDKLKPADKKMSKDGYLIRVGPLISHNYNGIQIEILFNGQSLKKPKRIWFNMKGIEKMQEIIEERRN